MNPSDYVDKIVAFWHPRYGGLYRAYVRKVTHGPRMGFRSLRVQFSSDPDASSLSAQFRGEKMTIKPAMLVGHYRRRKLVTL